MTFVKNEYKLKHIKVTHQEKVAYKAYKCSSCEKTFNKNNQLNAHIRRVHENKKDHKCDLCSKEFCLISELMNHFELIHGKKKDTEIHKCNSCGKIYKNKQILNRHNVEIHTKNLKSSKAKYNCSLCGKTF